jgi:hypothetical protein
MVLILTPGLGIAAQGGGEEPVEEAGNNLAMPVVWTDIAGPTLRGDGPQTATLPDAAAHVTQDSEVLFLQQDLLSTWQAENVALADTALPKTDTGQLALSYVDWGDNLESRDWSTKQKIRVETRLIQDVAAVADTDPAGTGMTGFAMRQVGTTTGPDEMWGVVATGSAASWTATQEQRTEAFAYTGYACLTIEKIDGGVPLVWNPTTRSWTGSPAVARCVGDVTDGSGSYGAEITISGGMTYGYVWDPKGLPDGEYRMTFSLGAKAGVDFVASTAKYVTATETEAVAAAEEPAEGGEGAANEMVILPDLNISYLDVGMTRTTPGSPRNMTATPGVESMALAWEPPSDVGDSDVTGYVVTAVGVGSVDLPATARAHTFTGLPVVARTFTVAARNATGVGVAATIVGTPLAKPGVVNPPVVNPPVVTPPVVTPPGTATKAVTVKATAVAGKSKVMVNVNPNKGKGYWRFQFEKKSGSTWKLLPKVYKTQGSAEKLTVNLKKGTYRAVVLPKYGYAGATSNAVTLKR